MNNYYSSLINLANKIIINQQKNEENEGIVIFFGNFSKAINFKKLKVSDILEANVGGGTNFLNAFIEAEKYIYDKNKFFNKRILFLTDGKADSSRLEPICQKMKKENFKINIVGFGLNSKFDHLKKFASDNSYYTSQNFKEVEKYCVNVFAAEENNL